ncbi:MAG: rhombosortase [Pseudomonadota bacterium]
MHRSIFTPGVLLSVSLSILILLFGGFGASIEPILEFNRSKIIDGEYWRLFTGNLVHYGFAHLAMNIAAFLIIGFSLLRDVSLKVYVPLFVSCAMAVGIGTLLWNPELVFYRGLSGVIHGLIVAGLLLNSFRNPWLSYLFVGLVFAKIFHEHQAGFQENQLQTLIPVPVAVDSHWYGALAGLIYMGLLMALQKIKKILKLYQNI